MLYPIMTESRAIFDLNGIWNFQFDTGKAFEEKWYEKPFSSPLQIAVPASYNDQYEGQEFKNIDAWIWYEKEFTLPLSLIQGQRVVLRIDAAAHHAKVYLNGTLLTEHRGGFIPFEAEMNDLLKEGVNRLTVAVDPRLGLDTLPVGKTFEWDIPTVGVIRRNRPNCDFFNYAGINRYVRIYTTPKEYIKDIVIVPDIKGQDGLIEYTVDTSSSKEVSIKILDEQRECVAQAQGKTGTITIPNAHFWAPLNSYLYTFQVVSGEDSYEEPFGIRTVEVKGPEFLINGKPFYFKGFGKHEDFPVSGRGIQPSTYIKDCNLMKWMGANSFRTSHYPYSEEFMRLADREGFVVIDEVAAVGLHFRNSYFGFNNVWDEIKTHEIHAQAIQELITRDKNHPCVVMWCLANESAEQAEGSVEYFTPLFALARSCDPQKRPITVTSPEQSSAKNNKIAEMIDVISLNLYYGWYSQEGDLRAASGFVRQALLDYKTRTPDKPVFITEYGVDTIAGMHDTTPTVFSEEYQVAFLKLYGEIFDEFPSLIGEHIWNFADFQTEQSIARVGGNKKGLFTRDRKPKQAVFTMKDRWLKIPNFNYKS